MRLLRKLIGVLLIVGLSGASPLLAASAGWVAGQATDAGGRPLAGLTVELLEARRGQPVGVPVQVNVTDGRGSWSFGSVPAGDYVVQIVHHEQIAGVPVSVTEASGVDDVLIVAPSLRVPDRFSQAQAGAAAGVGASQAWIAAAIGAAFAAASIGTFVVINDQS